MITQSSGFYNHDFYANVYYAAQITFERFIAAQLLRGDLSRVQFSSQEFCFRHRLETLDKTSTEITNISNLNFPFLSYWYDGFWSYDDRPYANRSDHRIVGLPVILEQKSMLAIAVKSEFVCTLFLNRDDDARLATELLMWAQGPVDIKLVSTVQWKETTIDIPVYLTIDNIQFNKENYNEATWLKTNRIFPIDFKVKLKTYIIGPNAQEKLVGPNNQLYNDSEDFTIVETAVHEFMNVKNFSDNKEMLQDSVTAYFNPDWAIDIISILASYPDQTDPPSEVPPGAHSLNLIWDYTWLGYDSVPPTQDPVTMIKITSAGLPSIEITDPSEKSALVTGLDSNSNYKFFLYFYTSDGKVYKRTVSKTTLLDPTIGDPRQLGDLKDLIGLRF